MIASRTYKAWSVVTASTTAFTVCFMVWMMFAVIGIPIKQNLGLNETQFGILVALPVLTGSLIRLPLGIWTDQFGGRMVFFILMLSTVFPIWLISRATEFWHFLVTGLFVGIAGGSFTVGIAYCARWFPRERQGLAMGASQVTVKEQLVVLKDPVVWRYSQYYSIVFGGYVALSLWMTKYYISEYGFDIRTAALLAAAFSIPGGLLRAIGGYFSDKYGAHTVTEWVLWIGLICLFFLSYPQTDLTIQTVSGPKTFHVGLNVVAFTVIMFTTGIDRKSTRLN